MSVRTLYDPRQHKSAMYCSTTGRAFGPVFDDGDAADFVDWMVDQHQDPRNLGANTIDIWVHDWKKERCAPSAA